MANHKSAIKRARQTIRRAKRNQATISSVKTAEKRVRAALSGKKATEVKELMRTYTSRMGKASQKGVIKAETASRKISRLSSLISKTLGN